MSLEDYHTQVETDPTQIPRDAWNDLLAMQAHPTPFLRHEYLAALHGSSSAVAATGWQPCFLLLWRGQALHAAVALYLKTHSYGEYVFDWAWADAYRRHGLDYYPKLLSAVPFTPVPGSRLLARSAADRAQLVTALQAWLQQQRWSSGHLLFGDEADRQALADAGWQIRHGVQFHWQQDIAQPMADFTELLARLQREKRKKIQQERKRVAAQGVSFRIAEGTAITAADWDLFYDCYQATYAAHRSTPYLTRRFFNAMSEDMPEHWVMFVAERDGRAIGCSLIAVDRARRAAWGRYWGCLEAVDCLHFEACYYQPLAWCLDHGMERFEGGAQGEHKMARGLLPVPTWSAHWIRDPRFADAVGDFLAREGHGVSAYLDELREHTPFKLAHSAPSLSETTTPGAEPGV